MKGPPLAVAFFMGPQEIAGMLLKYGDPFLPGLWLPCRRDQKVSLQYAMPGAFKQCLPDHRTAGYLVNFIKC